MTEEALRLTNAPIVEAVVDIECDLPSAIDFSEVQERAKQALSGSYPKARRQITQRQEFRPNAQEPAEVAVRQQVTGLQFLSEDEKQLVQFRAGGFSFNRLAPYGSLDEYLPEIERTWNIFREVTRPVQIRSIGLRFINRILLPVTDRHLDLSDYLQVMPQVPDDTLIYVGFLIQTSAVEQGTANRANITLVMEPPADGRLPIIFDIEALDPRSRAPEDWIGTREAILSLRRLKNRIFERTLTPACLNLFRQP